MKVLITVSVLMGYLIFSLIPTCRILTLGHTKLEFSIKAIVIVLCNLQFLLQIPSILLFFSLFSRSMPPGNRASKRRQCIIFFSLCSFLIILGFANSYLVFGSLHDKQWSDSELLAKDALLAGTITTTIADCAIWIFNLNIFFRILFDSHEERMKYLRRIYDSIILLFTVETVIYYYDAIGCLDNWAPLLILQHPIFCLICLKFMLIWLRKAKMRRLLGSRRNITHNKLQLTRLGVSSLMVSVFFFLIWQPLKRFHEQTEVLNPTCSKLKKYLYIDLMFMMVPIAIQSTLFVIFYIRCKKMRASPAMIPRLQSSQSSDHSTEEEEINALLRLMKPLKFTAEVQEISDIQSETECTICMEAYKVNKSKIFFIANCCHIFHYKCLWKWVKHRKRTCPKCRALITVN